MRAGWALVQGLCCTSRSWAMQNWAQLLPVLQGQFAWQLENARAASFNAIASSHGPSSTAVALSDVSYSAISDAWYWTSTAAAAGGLLAVVRATSASLGAFSEACASLAAVLSVELDILLLPVPGGGMSHVGEKASDSGAATPPRSGAGKSGGAGYQFDVSSVTGPTTSTQCASFVTRRSVLHTLACVMEASSLLPLTGDVFQPVHVRLLGSAILAVSGGLVGIHLPTVEALGSADDATGGVNVTVGQLMPAFLPSAHGSAPASSTFLLASALADSAIPETSFERACLFGADAVLGRGMGELSDPNVPASLRAALSATVL